MNDVDRFWSRVDREGDCWAWIGCHSDGYGQIRFGGKVMQAHRVSWIIHHGGIPRGKLVCHHCDNRGCVNPEHLYIGSHSDNLRDAIERKMHHPTSKTHCKRGHPLSGDNLIVWNDGKRACRACRNQRQKYWRGTGVHPDEKFGVAHGS